jgi:hypothetical protein
MSAAEITWRVREQVVRRAWASRQVRPGQLAALPPLTAVLSATERRFTSPLPAEVASLVPDDARAAIVAAADRLLKGEWEVLGTVRADMERPDWFRDPMTGRRSVPHAYAFSLDQRDESAVGNIKQVWEVNRLQHLTLLAVAWYLTGTDTYAERVAGQLTSWWRENPFLSGVNWTSGIELGIRLINFVWIRRLLDAWPPIADLFERNELALRQILWHQEYLAAFESRGSSANNHVIAEAAGQFAASCAFPWFPESGRWRRVSLALLERELDRNTFSSGVNRELATDYHGFVAELGYFAAIEASVALTPVSPRTWRLLCAMTDVMAALVDERVRPPRQGDSDEGRIVLLDAPEHNRWPTLLSLGDVLFGRLGWWPQVAPDAASTLIGGLLGQRRQEVAGRPSRRPDRFTDAGIALFRTYGADSPELYCRLDAGPHGFPSIAAHAHADALSVEVRYGGVDILADPGTYCYHGEPEWRKYFQSTIGHNTLEIDGQWQSVRGGPFLWLRHARGRETGVTDDGTIARWSAEHDGYARLRPPAVHSRSVRVDRVARSVEITDAIKGRDYNVRLAFHLGPEVQAELDGSVAFLRWKVESAEETARLTLPRELRWTLHRAETNPILGWYSPGLGHRVPAWTIVGTGRQASGERLRTLLMFATNEDLGRRVTKGEFISLSEPNGPLNDRAPGSQAEAG